MELSDSGKKELALALYLWKDFKSQGKFNKETAVFVKQVYQMAEKLGVKKELDEIYGEMPPFDTIFKRVDK